MNRHQHHRHDEGGITAIELMVVLVIVAVLATTALPSALAGRATAESDQARMSLVALDHQLRQLHAQGRLGLADTTQLAETLSVGSGAYSPSDAAGGTRTSQDPTSPVIDVVDLAESGVPELAVVAAAGTVDSCWLLRWQPGTRARWATAGPDVACTAGPPGPDPADITGRHRAPNPLS